MTKIAARFLALSGLLIAGLPVVAQADASQSEIPFLVTNQNEASQCVRCVGPLFRDTGPQEVWALTSMQEIFAARVTDLSPYGGWTCQLMAFDADAGQCASVTIAAADFCLLEDSGLANVALTIETNGSLSTNQPKHCATDAASVAFLGNRKRSGKRDSDSYVFTANAGNTVITTLEPKENSTETGKAAILGLRHRDSDAGSTFRKVVRGTLPLRIETTVPEPGEYEIFIAQPNRRRQASFHGFYRLSTRGNTLSPRLSDTQDAIEPVVTGGPLSPLPRDAGCYKFVTQNTVLDGELEVSNLTRFTLRISVSRDSNILGETILDPHTNFFCCSADDIPINSSPFTIAVEARENGTFVGSTRLHLANIHNILIDIVENESCP